MEANFEFTSEMREYCLCFRLFWSVATLEPQSDAWRCMGMTERRVQTCLVSVFFHVGRAKQFDVNVRFGNLWFLDCAFAGVIPSLLKLGKRQKLSAQ
jgi:hypothetical protein